MSHSNGQYPGYTIERLRYLFTPMFLNRRGRLKKSVRFHVIRLHLTGAKPTMLCGREMPDDYYTTWVHAITWDVLPVCAKCRKVAERDYSGFVPAAKPQ